MNETMRPEIYPSRVPVRVLRIDRLSRYFKSDQRYQRGPESDRLLTASQLSNPSAQKAGYNFYNE